MPSSPIEPPPPQPDPASTVYASDSSSATSDSDHGSDTEPASGSDSDPSLPDVEVATPSPSTPSTPTPVAPIGHRMTTRAKSGIFKPRHWADLSHTSDGGLYAALFSSVDPTTHVEALRDSKWLKSDAYTDDNMAVTSNYGAFMEKFILPPLPTTSPAQLAFSRVTFAVKDIFDMDGYVSATCIGRPFIDEMGYRSCSWLIFRSSGGFAVTVGANLADFSLETDPGGGELFPWNRVLILLSINLGDYIESKVPSLNCHLLTE
ncbi:unnamed protein product [Lactuca virosa]|uniref:Amidase domain-containing protein n=1 Tax=Lactuca virosa TaxID=75947 RepID=A0AAU9NRD2_9ASTR|nr:unnamed protein product [Lactuca virosa]